MLTLLGKELKNMTNLHTNSIVVRYTLVDESKQAIVVSSLQTYFNVEHDEQFAVDSLFKISDEHTFVVTTDVLQGRPVNEIKLPHMLEQHIDNYSIELFINGQLKEQLDHVGEPFTGVVNTTSPANEQTTTTQFVSADEIQPIEQSLFSSFAEEPEKDDTSVEGIVNSLLPDAEYIFERVSAPLSVEPKMLLNRDIMLLKSQYDASLNTINMMISDHLTNVLRSGTLEQDLKTIANKISSNPTSSIKDYQSALEDRNKMSEDIYEHVKNIQRTYAEKMEEWLAGEVEKLKVQYRAENPDDSEARIAAYIAEHIEDINAISLKVEETRKAAEESIIRAIAEYGDRKELIPVMRFLKTKDQYQTSLSEVVDAWKHEQELAARPAPIVAAPQPAIVEHTPEPQPEPEIVETHADELAHVEKHDIVDEDEFDDIDVEDLAKEVENEYDQEDHHAIEEKHFIEEPKEEPSSPFLEPQQPQQEAEDVLQSIDTMLSGLDDFSDLDDLDEFDQENKHEPDHGQMIPPSNEYAPYAPVTEQQHTEPVQPETNSVKDTAPLAVDNQPAIEKALGKEVVDRGADDELEDDLFADAKSAVSGLDLTLPSAISKHKDDVNVDKDDEDMDFDDDDFAEYDGDDNDDSDDDDVQQTPKKSGLSMKQIGLISGIVIALIAVIALVIMFLNPFGKKDEPAANTPTTTQQAPATNNSNSGTDSNSNAISTAPLASVGDTLVISIGGKEKNVKVTEVRSDGSVIVEDSDGTKLEIPYDKLKAALDK